MPTPIVNRILLIATCGLSAVRRRDDVAFSFLVPVRGYSESWNVKFEGIAVRPRRSAELVGHCQLM